MRVLAIDPGTTQSAWCVLDDDGRPVSFGIVANESMIESLAALEVCADVCAIETVASYGMAVGKETFRTVWWSGRFAERWASEHAGALPMEVYRLDVKLHLCKSAKANDSNIRAALIDIYGGEGGKEKAIGSKAKPGPLYGVTKDAWAALAVAVTAQSRFRPAKAA